MSKLDETIYNSFEQELIDNGYKIFQDNWKNSIRGFQKRFRDDKGTKYFISIYHYNFGKHHPEWDVHGKDSYQFDVQFRIDKEGKDNCIDIKYSAGVLPNEYRPITSLKEIEQFFEEFFIKFNVDYYEES